MKMVFRKLQNVLVLLLCSALLIRFSDAKDFRYKHYTFRKKQRLVSIGLICEEIREVGITGETNSKFL